MSYTFHLIENYIFLNDKNYKINKKESLKKNYLLN